MSSNVNESFVEAHFGTSFSNLPRDFWQAGGDPLSDGDGKTTLEALSEHDDRHGHVPVSYTHLTLPTILLV